MPRRRASLAAAAVLALVCAAPASANESPPRHVRYTVTAVQPATADIYYRDADPATWAEYSHNPYRFSPKAEVVVGPDTPWVLDVALVDPQRWAMVAATSGPSPVEPQFRCELAVDGVVVSVNEGPKGALCSLRHW